MWISSAERSALYKELSLHTIVFIIIPLTCESGDPTERCDILLASVLVKYEARKTLSYERECTSILYLCTRFKEREGFKLLYSWIYAWGCMVWRVTGCSVL